VEESCAEADGVNIGDTGDEADVGVLIDFGYGFVPLVRKLLLEDQKRGADAKPTILAHERTLPAGGSLL
jgi:hypothetical protein